MEEEENSELNLEEEEEDEDKVPWKESLLDLVHFAHDKLKQLRERWTQLELVATLVFGLFLVFFGRNVIFTFTVWEACQLGNARVVMEQLVELNQLRKLRRLARKEAKGKRFRKRFPTKQELASVLSQIAMTVASLFKWGYAGRIALGASLGNDLGSFSVLYILPRLRERFPGLTESENPKLEVRVWYLSRLLALVFAMVFYSAIQVITTSFRGATTVASVLEPRLSDRQLEFIVVGLSVTGVVFQSLVYNALPPQVKAIFLPAYVFELAWTRFKEMISVRL
ncbi:hypothetical protein BASA81_006465 [Batrachochytrium salamandrivorans]|nr:hypothetical protein BASA81_006465 [Batrachochytrium salamandrivorans]